MVGVVGPGVIVREFHDVIGGYDRWEHKRRICGDCLSGRRLVFYRIRGLEACSG